MKTKPDMNFWKLWNISFGFFRLPTPCKVRTFRAFFAHSVPTRTN